MQRLVAGLRGSDPAQAVRKYFATFFGPDDEAARTSWILERAFQTPPHVMASVWEESVAEWDDVEALRRCDVPVAFLDAGTPNADLSRAVELCPQLLIGRTIGSGHFSPLVVADQINAMIQRFLSICDGSVC